MRLWHRTQNPLVSGQPCKCLFTAHSVHLWMVFLDMLWAVGLPTPSVLVISNVQAANENVQKFALRACTRDWKADYNTLLERCKVPTLAQRRKFMKLCFMYQVVNQLVVLPSQFIERRTLLRSLRNSSSYDLQRPIICCTSAHQFSFFPHTIELWNRLPLDTQSCGSLISFKSNLPNSI